MRLGTGRAACRRPLEEKTSSLWALGSHRLFLVRCSPAPVLGIGLLLALEGELPLLAAGPWEDPARSSMEFTKHTTPSPGTKVRRSGSDSRSNHSTAMAQSPALKAVLCDSSRWSKATRARTKGRRAGTHSSEERKKAQAKGDAARCSAAEYRECECHPTKKTGARRWRRGCAFLYAAPDASPDTAPDSALDAALDAAQCATGAALSPRRRSSACFEFRRLWGGQVGDRAEVKSSQELLSGKHGAGVKQGHEASPQSGLGVGNDLSAVETSVTPSSGASTDASVCLVV